MISVSPLHLKIIKEILHKYVPNCEVRVFGSRITDTVKNYSDLDIVIVSENKLSKKNLYSLKEAFEESDLPFRVDVLDWNNISPEFREVISKKYEVLQKSNNQKL
ncbi:MAG: nucleotidyltransferase domain-containing protein [Elusimicrobia bacterium]|nr:nucleotidyltransferase domain-containing protein [Elusimicrobiota bacterium]